MKSVLHQELWLGIIQKKPSVVGCHVQSQLKSELSLDLAVHVHVHGIRMRVPDYILEIFDAHAEDVGVDFSYRDDEHCQVFSPKEEFLVTSMQNDSKNFKLIEGFQKFASETDFEWFASLLEFTPFLFGFVGDDIFLRRAFLTDMGVEGNAMIDQVTSIFQEETPVVDLNLKEDQVLHVVGDIHGQFFDLLNIFRYFGLPSDTNRYLFTGDYVDRGDFSKEVLISLLLMKLDQPDNVFLLRGNHESHSMNVQYGFWKEIRRKFTEEKDQQLFFSKCLSLFDRLPLAAIVNEGLFVCHGGIGIESSENRNLEAVRKVCTFLSDENDSDFSDEVVRGLLWSDPAENVVGLLPSSRGSGTHVFGPDISKKFLEENNLNGIIRSHEATKALYTDKGFNLEANQKVATIFSCPNYCGSGNSGSLIRITGETNTLDFDEERCEMFTMKPAGEIELVDHEEVRSSLPKKFVYL